MRHLSGKLVELLAGNWILQNSGADSSWIENFINCLRPNLSSCRILEPLAFRQIRVENWKEYRHRPGKISNEVSGCAVCENCCHRVLKGRIQLRRWDGRRCCRAVASLEVPNYPECEQGSD